MKVLVATEGSEFGQAAIKKCCEIFDESVNTEIRIISVVEPQPTFIPADPFSVSIDDFHKAEAAAMKNANNVVYQAETEIRTGFPDLAVNLTTKVVKGLPKQAIVEEAENWGADLIIMGSHGYGFWNRAVLGSVSNAVSHQAPCSVLIARPPKEQSGKDNKMGVR